MIRKLVFAVAAAGAIAGAAVAATGVANATGPYKNCSQAKADGVCNITQDSPYYMAKLDRDGDGIACEC